jgi:predicted kinase
MTLVILRGVPGSGKSTHAMSLVSEGWTRINRDEIRLTMFGKYWGVDEEVVTDVENSMLDSALGSGHNVVLDATNLHNKSLKTKLSIASAHGVGVEYRDFPVTMQTAIWRDAQRQERTVGEAVIRSFFKRYKINPVSGILPPPPELLPVFEPYVRSPDAPYKAYIVDTDGTVANHAPHRSPYDTTKYHLDTPIQHVVEVVKALSHDFVIIGLSGRDEEFRAVTTQWWWNQGLKFDEFLMRPKGDTRMDAIIKYELFKEWIEPNYDVLGAFDDRPQVIRMWKSIGVPVLNVGDGREF